jgi:hypothetical protein
MPRQEGGDRQAGRQQQQRQQQQQQGRGRDRRQPRRQLRGQRLRSGPSSLVGAPPDPPQTVFKTIKMSDLAL